MFLPMCPLYAQGVSQCLQGLGLRVDSCQHVADHLAAKLVSRLSICHRGEPM